MPDHGRVSFEAVKLTGAGRLLVVTEVLMRLETKTLPPPTQVPSVSGAVKGR